MMELPGFRGFTDWEGTMSRLGSSPIEALGASSGRLLRGDDRAEPAGAPSEGTVDSVEPDGASMTGSDERTRGDEPAPAAGEVTTAPEPQLVQGAATVAGEE